MNANDERHWTITGAYFKKDWKQTDNRNVKKKHQN